MAQRSSSRLHTAQVTVSVKCTASDVHEGLLENSGKGSVRPQRTKTARPSSANKGKVVSQNRLLPEFLAVAGRQEDWFSGSSCVIRNKSLNVSVELNYETGYLFSSL